MSKFKRILWDISGAFGDIGILFPIALALVAKNGFNPTALFLMAGLFYIASSWYFRITMPVQPLKAMSAIAIASGMGFEVINAAGLAMGLILLLIAFTGASEKLGSLFPIPVVRGIQLGLGLILVNTAAPMISAEMGIALCTMALLGACLVLFRHIPPLIPVLIFGIALAFGGVDTLALGPVAMRPSFPGSRQILDGFVLLVLPQIALTFGNAIVATEATGKLLYGERADRLTLRRIPLSMAAANIISGIFGGAPMCHGCGGLTAHNKFGARSERSGYIIGGFLLVLALPLGSSALSLISAFPTGILGVLLLYVGIQHSLFVRDILGDATSMAIALSVAVVGFATSNLSAGFAAGFVLHYSIQAAQKAHFMVSKSKGGNHV